MSTLNRRRLLAGALGGSAAWGLGGCDRGRDDDRVRLWFTYGGRNREVLLSMVERFNREVPGASVEATFQGDYFEGLIKLRTGLFVGSVPTVTHVVGEVLPYLAEAEVLEPLDAVGGDVLADLDPALAQVGSFEGGGGGATWGLPFNRSTPIAYCNQTLFDELGLEPPETWGQLRDVARTLTRRGGAERRWGFECPIDWWFWCALLGQAGGEIVEGGRVTLGGGAGTEALRLWQAMVHEDRTMKPPPGRDFNAWEATNTDFLAGRVGMIWTSTAFLRYLEDNASFAVRTAPLPRRERFAVPTGGTFFVMPRGLPPAQRDAGLAFLRWMMQPPQANEWAQRTGYMSISLEGRRRLEEAGYFRAHPNDRVTLDQLAHARPWPWSPELFRIQREAVQPRLEEAILGRRDPASVLDDARRSANGP